MEYDYIVVGSGPAGSVLANMLSEGNSVLLLEAGGNNDGDALIKDPNSNLYAHMPEYFEMGTSVPQRNLGGRTFNLTGGRTAGGGSSVNGEMYVRPSPYVLEQWERIGGRQWSAENATRNFMEMERYHGGTNLRVHGDSGRLQIRQVFRETPKLLENFVSSVEEATGYGRVDDYNDPDTPVGPFTRWQLYQKPNGERASASVCFLSDDIVDKHGRGRDGRTLRVMFESVVTRVMFSGKRAKGVEYMQCGELKKAHARKKVILSAGLQSTKILMLSGIGPEDVLRKANIPVVHANKNVGRNYAHDAYVNVRISVNADDMGDLMKADPAGKFVGGAFLPNPLDDSEKRRFIQMIPSIGGPDVLYMSVLCVDPRSRGTLRIQANDPFKVMLGDFGFLEDGYDLDILVAALKRYIGPLGEAISKKGDGYRLLAPSPDILDDDDKLREYVRSTFIHTYHDQCQLSMGDENEGVVDGYGNVYGVEDLVVADASIIPYHMDGNTSACAYLIGYTVAKHLLDGE